MSQAPAGLPLLARAICGAIPKTAKRTPARYSTRAHEPGPERTMRIKVACRSVLVKPCQGKVIEELTSAPGAMGCDEYDKNRILLKSGMPESIRAVTLMHELIHDISSSYSMRLSEQNVDTLATAFVTLLRDNPRLVDILTGKKQKK
jgi:hypothetical protein